MDFPILYSAHHASWNFGEFNEHVALDNESKKRFCDLGTDVTVPRNGIATYVGDYSRGLIDLNRAPDSPTLYPEFDFARPKPHNIWLPNNRLSETEKKWCMSHVYDTYHGQILKTIEEYKKNMIVVAWDNTAHYNIGLNAAGKEQMMVPIVLSNNGDEGSAYGDHVTCRPEFLLAFGDSLSIALQQNGLPSKVHYNLVFRGGYITKRYTNFERNNDLPTDALVQSFQVEYDMSITHDQSTLMMIPKNVSLLTESFTSALRSVREYL